MVPVRLATGKGLRRTDRHNLFDTLPRSGHAALEQEISVMAGNVAEHEVGGKDLAPDFLAELCPTKLPSRVAGFVADVQNQNS